MLSLFYIWYSSLLWINESLFIKCTSVINDWTILKWLVSNVDIWSLSFLVLNLSHCVTSVIDNTWHDSISTHLPTISLAANMYWFHYAVLKGFYNSSHLSKRVTKCIYISVRCICGKVLKCVHVCWFIKRENVMGLI